MHSRFRLLICLAAAALFLAACSSTTVVARDERATATEDDGAQPVDESVTTNNDDTSDSSDTEADSDADADDAVADADTDADADDEADRGGRDAVDSAEGFGLGGEEQLQGLLTDCEDNNDLACDILFQISDFDSEEETAAITCGGRSDVEVLFCTDGIEPGETELVFAEDSAGLDRVVEACETDANMTACDFLFYRSPIDSEFQEIGATCGGRVNVAIPDCRTFIDSE